MKVLIIDNPNKDRGFSVALKRHPEVKIKKDNLQSSDFEGCKFIFKHDYFDENLIPSKQGIIFVEFSGGSGLENIIEQNNVGYKFKARIQSPSQINTILDIIHKNDFTEQDLEFILDIDSKLEDLLQPFAFFDPLANSKELKSEKAELQKHITQILNK